MLLNYTLKIANFMLYTYFTTIKEHIRKAKKRRRRRRKVNGRVCFKGRESNKQLCSKRQFASSSGKGVKETSLTYFADLDLKELSQVWFSDLDSFPWREDPRIKILPLLHSHGQVFGDSLLPCIYISYST